jgi:hypothetical protein
VASNWVTPMRRHLQYLAALLFLAALPLSAQSTLPDGFAGWTAGSKGGLQPPIIYNGDHVGSMMGQRADAALKEYGFVSGEQATYKRNSDSLQIKLYKMKDASGAFGEFFYLRTPDMRVTSGAPYSALSHNRAILLDGNLVLEIEGQELSKLDLDMKALFASVNLHAQQGGLPTLRQHMPQKGLVEGTDYYVLGPNVLFQFAPLSQDDWLGFSQDTEAELAKYKVDGREVTLLIADFPTPQLATAKLAELQQKFNVNGSKSDAKAQPLFVKRSLTLLAITLGARSQSEADILLNQVHTTTEVTWNEPTFSLTEPSFPAMIVGVFVGTGVICLFAMISSVAFGGLRLIVKRFYPNKIFDRGSEIQILQLGLSSKPINAEDFYSLQGPNPN